MSRKVSWLRKTSGDNTVQCRSIPGRAARYGIGTANFKRIEVGGIAEAEVGAAGYL
jgi:hypothetical protein